MANAAPSLPFCGGAILFWAMSGQILFIIQYGSTVYRILPINSRGYYNFQQGKMMQVLC